jgi:hypothetical protein
VIRLREFVKLKGCHSLHGYQSKTTTPLLEYQQLRPGKKDRYAPTGNDQFFEMQRRMVGVVFQQGEAFISKFLNLLGQGSIISPKFG